MADQELIRTAEQMEQKIVAADSIARIELQPAFNRLLKTMRKSGVLVPLRMRRLDDALSEEVQESYFDNMPV